MNAREAWSKSDAPPPDVSLDEIVARAEKLRKRLRSANAREYAAGALVIVLFVAMAAVPDLTHLPDVSRIGAALIACATVFVLTYLALRGAAGDVRRDESTLACYRAELERRRALLASVPKWYVAPFWPGTLLFFAGMLLAHPGEPAVIRAVTLSFLFAFAVNAGVIWINVRGARKLAREIESLPTPEGSVRRVGR